MIAGTINSTIERRLLVNYRISPAYVAALLPEPFRPQLVSGHAVGGVCFLRLGQIRTPKVPRVLGLTTENVAHRFAVEWDDADGTHTGVYIPRRDTDSWMTLAAGGRVFPGSHHLARFQVDEPGEDVRIEVSSRDGQVRLVVQAVAADRFKSEVFASFDAVTRFFRRAALGFSPAMKGGCLEGVRLESRSWAARPMKIEHMKSSLFDDAALFPVGTCTLDSALVKRELPVRWVTGESIPLPGRAA
jgi:Uncharacterized conserved protein (COG2071)